MNASLLEIASIVNGVLIGDTKVTISSLAPITDIAVNSLVFADGMQNLQLAEKSPAAAILVGDNLLSKIKPIIQVSHPLKAFIQLLNYFYPSEKPPSQIHPTAVIADNVSLGKNLFIGAYAVIESGGKIADNCVIKSHAYLAKNVSIGADTTIHPHVTVYEGCQIGARVTIHASAVIGTDGFGYTYIDSQHLKIPHTGNVIIEDEVEIGANTTIDRATLGSTVIGEGTKIDNLVQIAHSVKLGKQNILCAFTGVAGSTVSGDNVIFAADVGVSDHVRIDDGVILGARAGVPPKKHLKSGNIYVGNPARPKKKAIEQELGVTCIPQMRRNLKKLSQKITAIQQQLDTPLPREEQAHEEQAREKQQLEKQPLEKQPLEKQTREEQKSF